MLNGSPTRFPAAPLKFGSISQNMSIRRAISIQQQSQIILLLLRFRSRESSRQNGTSQWQMKSSEQMVHHPPWMRLRYHGSSSGMLPDQMIRNSAKVR